MSESTPILELINISKVYNQGSNKIMALNDLNFKIYPGEMIAIIGPSGSGKSTLLNIMGLLDTPTEGEYLIEGKNENNLTNKEKASYRNSMFGFIVQDFALIEKYTVEQNIKIPFSYLKNTSMTKTDKELKVNSLLSNLQIKDKKKELACNLSGGQRQRVAIARAIINNPKVIFADEPTGSLDLNTASEIMNILKGLHKSGKTIIIVTHDLEIANQCDKVIEIKNGILIS